MSSNQSVFADDWRMCLREHYMYVVRENDARKLQSLNNLMHDMGFDDTELAELRVLATMHVDDVSEDFMPDLNALDAQPQPVPQVNDGDEHDDEDYIQLSLF